MKENNETAQARNELDLMWASRVDCVPYRVQNALVGPTRKQVAGIIHLENAGIIETMGDRQDRSPTSYRVLDSEAYDKERDRWDLPSRFVVRDKNRDSGVHSPIDPSSDRDYEKEVDGPGHEMEMCRKGV